MTGLGQAVEPDESAAPEPSQPSAGWLLDCLVCLAFVLLAAWLAHGLWPDPGRRVLALNQQDQVLYEWLLANDTRALFGDLGLLTDRLNAPDGVNLMANTSVIALGLLLAPVTLAFGAPTTFALLVAGNLAVTAVAWYFLYTRVLGASRTAAVVGAGLCGFAPGIVSQSNGHLHMTAQWLVPVLVWLTVRLWRAADPTGRPAGQAGAPGRDVRRIVTSAVGLAVVAVVQVFIGEEVLFLAGITLALLAAAYAVLRPAEVRRVAGGVAAGMLLATGLALAVLAYPLRFQFAGPQGVRSGLFDPHYYSADRASWLAFSPLSLAGGPSSAHLAAGAAEYTTFLGWPLLLVVVGCGVWLVRRPLATACLAAAVVMADLSLGPHLVVNGVRSAIPGPYVLLTDLPLFESALPTRFALAVGPLLATVLVLAVDRARRTGRPGDPDGADSLGGPQWLRRSARVLVPGLIVAALVPIFPTPLPTAERAALPQFVTAGHWRDCVPPGGVLVPVPLPTPGQPGAMRWGAAANAGFGIPEGLFIGPYGRDGNASMGRYPLATSTLLADVARTGAIPRIDDARHRQARLDLATWHASCVVLDPGAPHAEALLGTLQALFGPGRRIADVWAWPV